jgi:uncharacterized membrane protein YjjP (DUF1212 family)
MKKIQRFFEFTDRYVIPLLLFAMGFACGALYGLIKAILIIG